MFQNVAYEIMNIVIVRNGCCVYDLECHSLCSVYVMKLVMSARWDRVTFIVCVCCRESQLLPVV